MPHVRSAKLRSVISSRPLADRRRRTFDGARQFSQFTPIAQAIALVLAAGGAIGTIGTAQAAQPFSAGWYAGKGALQETARATGMVNGKSVSSLTNPAAQQQQANAQLQQSIANLSLAARGIAMRQAAAHQAQGDMPYVPDGLGKDGLNADSLTASWLNANAPTQTTDANGKTVVNIAQTADKAVANWESFNIGKNTIVQFAQQPDWAILNRIVDPLASPSQIQGQIRAPGTVLIVNKNGIVFSGTSQINTRNLVAAAADIDPTQFGATGIYSVQTSGVYLPSFTNASGKLIVEAGAQINTAAPTTVTQGGGYVLLMGKNVSNAGDIETPKGQIAMAAGDNFVIRKGFGTDVNQSSTTRGNEIAPNAGSIGQVINTGFLLAREGDITLAGHDVQQNGAAVATTTVDTRGTIHLLNSASDVTGSVSLGSNATTAILIDDDGKTTALDSQRDALSTLSGNPLATTQFDNLSSLPDRRDQSRVEIVSGGNVNFTGPSITLATGGQIAVSATKRTFVANGAILDVAGAVGVQVAMDSNNLLVNVQGNELRDAPINRDSGKLANSNVWVDTGGLLYAPAIKGVDDNDRWYTAGGLLEVSGYLSNQGHRIGEWASLGGTVALSGNEVVTQAGSQINISGGSIDTTTGYLKQTWLKGSDGQLYNINNAPADLLYSGVYKGFENTHPRWGDSATETFYNPLIAPQQVLRNGYTVGRDAGQLIVSTPTGVLEGDLVSAVYNGPQQTGSRPSGAVDGYKLGHDTAALEGRLVVGLYTGLGLTNGIGSQIKVGDIDGITQGMGEGDALVTDRTNAVWLDATRLNAQELGGMTLISTDKIAIDAPLTLATGGQLTLTAPNIDILADITAHSGTINLGNQILPPAIGTPTWREMHDGQGQSLVTIDNNARIDLSGLWVNQFGGNNASGLAFLNGGTLDVATTGGVTFSAGSIIDVSSGGAILSGGKASGGKVGNVSLIANDDSRILGATIDPSAPLAVEGKIIADGFNGGGTLTLRAGQTVVIGDDVGLTGGNIAAGRATATSVRLAQDVVVPAGGTMPFDYDVISSSVLIASYKAGDVVSAPVTLPAGTVVPVGAQFDHAVAIQPVLALKPELFSSGFSNYAVSSNTGMEISGNVSANVPVYRFNAASLSAPTGSRIGDAAELWLPPTYLEDPLAGHLTQRAGASLTLSSLYDFNMTHGSSVTVDPGQNVTVYANRQTTIDGAITAHGGNITVASVPNAASSLSYGDGAGFATSTRSVWIGENSTLDVSAQAVIALDAGGHRYGVVPSGGSITLGETILQDGKNTIVASDAFIIVRPGAVLDASGTAGMIDVRSSSGLQPTMVASDGGAISLYSASGMYLDGEMRAVAGGTGASGGLLSLNVLGHALLPTLPTTVNPFGIGEIPEEMQRLRNITIVQNDLPTALSADLTPGERDPALKFGEAIISVDKIHAGGFDQLSLSTKDLFVFSGNIDLAMNRAIALSGGIISASANTPHSNVHLAAPYVKLDGRIDDDIGPIGSENQYIPDINTIRGPSLNTASDSTFRIDADLIDVSSSNRFGVHAHQGSGSIFKDPASAAGTIPALPSDDTAMTSGGNIVDAPGFDNVVLHSSGDVRFGTGFLTANRNLVIDAAQIYPLSGATADITAGLYLPLIGSGVGNVVFDPAGMIAILKNGQATPDVAPSVFGNLALMAPNIDQGGVVRAPLGIVLFNDLFSRQSLDVNSPNLVFRSGSVTSTSAMGLTIPFGGTSDGVTYLGSDGTIKELGATNSEVNNRSFIETGLSIKAQTLIGEAGAVLDVSGGGNLLGAGFISGRGGSVNVLATALVNANPANSIVSSAGDKVYAIVPGVQSSYAPLTATKGTVDPAIGQQITIPSGMPGLPAGTYTLLPSSYALLPGAYRVELGNKTSAITDPIGLANGSVMTSAYLGFANTSIRDSLPTQLILTSGQTVRTYSQYNETSYANLLRSQAAIFEAIRPRLPIDGGIIQINLGTPLGGEGLLSFAGSAQFDGVSGGIDGTLVIGSTAHVLDIVASGVAATPGHTTISADDINAFNAPTVVIGGTISYNDGKSDGTGEHLDFSNIFRNEINIRGGATLRAGQIFVIGQTVNVSDGATLDTRGRGSNGIDSTLGYAYGSDGVSAVLAVANGWFNFLPIVGNGNLNIGSGVSLLTEGSIVLGAPGSLVMGDANLGARYLAVTQNTVNVGTDASLANALAAGQLPSGWDLTQGILDRLLRPSTTAGVPALEQLTIVAGGSINLFGDVSLDARGGSGHDVQFVMNTPALYGLAGAGEGAHLFADTFVWNGIRTGNGKNPVTDVGGVLYGSKDPAPILPNGPGTGLGSLDIAANTVLFGYGDHTRATDGVALDRYAIGFSAVNVNAGEQVTTNSDGALFVGLSRDGSGNVQGGNLNIATPLVTARQGAVMAFNAGGVIAVTAPAGAVPADTASATALGGTVSFNGDSVVFDTAAALPSGKLTLNAANNVSIGGNAVIDLSGHLLTFFDKSVYSWGGDLVLQSAHGNIMQAAGSLIDVSARNNVAGTVTATAVDPANGNVLFNGVLKGSSSGAYASGEFTIQAQSLGDFSALNVKLNDAGFFGARTFDIKRGDLVVGNEVKANVVSISVDGGSLTINGTIDASGDNPGTIRLASRDDLTLASSAVLDTHSTRLKTDSYGAPIDADNTSHVELTSANGFVNLDGGATIDMRSADKVPRGKLEINVPRLGSTGTSVTSGAAIPDAGDGTLAAGGAVPANAQGDDIAISAGGSLNILGASSVAVNAFATYKNAPVDAGDPNNQIITQKYLDLIDQDSQAFIANIYGGDVAAGTLTANLQNKLAGLIAYGDGVFHVRPGIEIESATPTGKLSTQGDLDFVGYRYGPGKQAGVLGSGEPGKLVIRAGNDLQINGSITDGFAPPPDTPDKNLFLTISAPTVASQEIVLSSNVILGEDWTVPNDNYYNFVMGGGIGGVFDTSFNFYAPGATIPAGTVIDAVDLPFAWEAGITIPALKVQGAPKPVYALAQPLAPGSMSWSMRLVSGADTGAADSRVLRSASDLDGAGNMLLSDAHSAGSDGKAVASVIRTGTGDLELLAGGNYTQSTPYGIYTAGTQIPVAGDAALYNPGRGTLADDGKVLGAAYPDYEATLGPQYMYYMQNGGDLLLSVQGNINGNLSFDSKEVGGWLWRQGGAELGQATAWGINFGSYTASPSMTGSAPDFTGVAVHLSTFSGIGTLGGGNVNVQAGGNIGNAGGVVIAVGGSGRVMADGTLVQTGGGTLSVKAGGNVGGAGNQFVDIRGDTNVSTGDFGSLYGQSYGYDGVADPRPLDTLKTYSAAVTPGGSFVPGDGAINIRARGDIAMGDIIDPGRIRLTEQTDVQGLQAATWFTLWTPQTAVNIFGAGGSVSPLSALQGSDLGVNSVSNVSTLFLPSILRVTSGNGDIFLFSGDNGASLMLPSPSGELQLLAAGSVIDTVRPGSSAYGPLVTSTSTLATPFHPGWATFLVDNNASTLKSSNYWGNPNEVTDGLGSAYSFSYSTNQFSAGFFGVGGNPFVFAPNTVSDASAFGSSIVSSVYALQGDILNLRYGEIFIHEDNVAGVVTDTNFYRAAKPVGIRTGGDIVNLQGMILQNDPNDVSVIAASGDIIYAGVATHAQSMPGGNGPQIAGLMIAGPGTLEISAGKNLYEGDAAAIESIGPLVAGDKRPGASVVLQAGLGDGAPGEGQVDWTGFAKRYLDAANLAGPGPLADQPGKVAETYNNELVEWLKTRFGYTGSAGDALADFLALPSEQQHIFLRTVYYAELTVSGREFNDKSGPRFGSYLRGRDAIAALFPNEQAYGGSITMFTGDSPIRAFSNVGGFVHTDFGGDIQLLAPGGDVTLGTDNATPRLDTGLITQGSGNIQIYSEDSLLLGLSRIMTTFGGNILAWSATGDINAGRGSKTTVVFTPPKRTYDDVGDVAIAPDVPSTGAGIATLNPISEVPPGDVDLIAPLGTIDAGEAGIRVSGNVNLAALQVANAANIQVQGKSTGLPLIASVNVNALTNAGAAATQATVAAQDVMRQQQTAARQALPSIFTVRVLGFGNEPADGSQTAPQPGGDQPGAAAQNRQHNAAYNPGSAFQVLGQGKLDSAQMARLTEAERQRLPK